MAKLLITGAQGFVGKNLLWAIEADRIHRQYTKNPEPGHQVLTFTRGQSEAELAELVAQADFVFHLAGVNRPLDDQEFDQVNRGLTAQLIAAAKACPTPPPIAFASSTQADRENAYGLSKRAAEKELENYHLETGVPVLIYRLPNLFGKWGRPHYNSAVATFCHNLARGLEIEVRDPKHPLTLLYIDDLVAELLYQVEHHNRTQVHYYAGPILETTLGEVADLLRSFGQSRKTLGLPDVDRPLAKKLYSTYLSYLPPDQLAYPLTQHSDPRGAFCEALRSPSFGQLSFSTTKPGVTRGNHFHQSKVEKFIVVSGEALIEFRALEGTEILRYPVCGERPQVLDIPPGYTHKITNTSDTRELVTLFWCNESFDPQRPDTYFLEL